MDEACPIKASHCGISCLQQGIYFNGFAAQLFDLAAAPDEFNDVGRDPEYEPVLRAMQARLAERLVSRKNRVTITDAQVLQECASLADAFR